MPGEIVRVGLVWRDCDDLEVGVAALERPSAAKCWGSNAWSVVEGSIELAWEKAPPGPIIPLEFTSEGEIAGNFGRPGAPSISADGSRIAFGALDASSYGVFVADLSARTVLECARFDGVSTRKTSVVWIAASGDRLAFSVEGRNRRRSYVVDLGHRRRALIPGLSELSSDGGHVLYTDWSGSRIKLMVLDLDTNLLRTVFEKDIAPSSERERSADRLSRHGGACPSGARPRER